MTLFTLAAALLPAFALVWYFAKSDVFPEPIGRLAQSFFLGVAAIVPVLFVALPVAGLLSDLDISSPWIKGTLDAFLVAAIPEELCKFGVVWLVCSRWKEFDEPMDGVVYGATASLGFAAFENVLYVADGGIATAIMRGVTAVPAHACFGAVMGHYVAWGRFDSANRANHLLKALGFPILLHGVYDIGPLAISAMGGQADGLSVLVMWAAVIAVMVIQVRWVRRLVRIHRQVQVRAAARHSVLDARDL